MSGLCANATPVTTDAQLDVAFTGSVLPPVNSGRIASGDLKGRLSADALERIYQTLVAQGSLVGNDAYKQDLARLADTRNTTPTAAIQILEQLGTKETTTMRKLQDEYCFYYLRYKYCLNALFDKLVASSKTTQLAEADKTEVQNKLTRAKEFNEKLNDLIQITNYIAQKRAQEMRTQNNEINAMNTNLNTTFQALQAHRRILNSETSVQDLRKSMVGYTEEKNRSALNLLSLYGFLNLVAVGLLVYLARS